MPYHLYICLIFKKLNPCFFALIFLCSLGLMGKTWTSQWISPKMLIYNLLSQDSFWITEIIYCKLLQKDFKMSKSTFWIFRGTWLKLIDIMLVAANVLGIILQRVHLNTKLSVIWWGVGWGIYTQLFISLMGLLASFHLFW